MAPYRGDFREKPRVFTADDDNVWQSLRITGQSFRSFTKLSTKRTSFAEHCSSTKEVYRGNPKVSEIRRDANLKDPPPDAAVAANLHSHCATECSHFPFLATDCSSYFFER